MNIWVFLEPRKTCKERKICQPYLHAKRIKEPISKDPKTIPEPCIQILESIINIKEKPYFFALMGVAYFWGTNMFFLNTASAKHHNNAHPWVFYKIQENLNWKKKMPRNIRENSQDFGQNLEYASLCRKQSKKIEIISETSEDKLK